MPLTKLGFGSCHWATFFFLKKWQCGLGCWVMTSLAPYKRTSSGFLFGFLKLNLKAEEKNRGPIGLLFALKNGRAIKLWPPDSLFLGVLTGLSFYFSLPISPPLLTPPDSFRIRHSLLDLRTVISRGPRQALILFFPSDLPTPPDSFRIRHSLSDLLSSVVSLAPLLGGLPVVADAFHCSVGLPLIVSSSTRSIRQLVRTRIKSL